MGNGKKARTIILFVLHGKVGKSFGRKIHRQEVNGDAGHINRQFIVIGKESGMGINTMTEQKRRVNKIALLGFILEMLSVTLLVFCRFISGELITWLLILSLFVLSPIGFVFSIIGLKKANTYIKQYGEISQQVKIGKILSIIGIVGSSIMTIFWLIWITVMIIAGVAVASLPANGNYYYRYTIN